MSRPKKTREPSVKNDMTRMHATLIEAMTAHMKHSYKRCRQKLYELSVMTAEYGKKGKG